MNTTPATRDWVDDLDALEAIESALTGEQHAVLRQIVRLAGVEPDAWLSIPALRQAFGHLASLNIRRRMEGMGMSAERSLLEASRRLRIPHATLVGWSRRWRTYTAFEG